MKSIVDMRPEEIDPRGFYLEVGKRKKIHICVKGVYSWKCICEVPL